jgi:hypothetical protein
VGGISRYRARFERVDVSLGNTVKEMLAGAENFQEEVAKFIKGMDDHLGASLNSLAGGVEDLKEVAESIESALSSVPDRQHPRYERSSR